MSRDNPHARFAGDWLALREPADHAARDDALTAHAARVLRTLDGAHSIVDLGSGRGSNLRYLAPRLPGPQCWHLVDHDDSLLAHAMHATRSLTDANGQAITARGETRDLTDTTLESTVAGARLVTAAALFDLVTEAWIARLARACAHENAAVLFVLSVDGGIGFTTVDEDDEDDDFVTRLLRAHQRRDKSFGAALGTDAPDVLARCFKARGYAVQTAASVWQIDVHTQALGCALIDGWRQAARQQCPDQCERIAAWADRRRRALCQGNLRITVSHQDLFAVPPRR